MSQQELALVYDNYHKTLGVRKWGKAQSIRNMKKKLREGYTIPQFYTAIKNYNKYSEGTDRAFIYRCTNFFGMAEYFVDFLEAVEPEVKSKAFKSKNQVEELKGNVSALVDNSNILDAMDI